MKIIDCHIHFRPEIEAFCEIAKRSGHENSKRHLEEVFERNNICHAIVMGNFEPNVENHMYPDFLSYCIGLDSNTFDDRPIEYFVDLVEENLKRDSCVGIKIYPGYCHYYPYDEIYHPFYRLAQKYNKPVAIHTGAVAGGRGGRLLKYSHPLNLDETAELFPNVNFVMCHFGNPWLCDAAAVAEKNKNVMIDLSGILEGNFEVDEFFKNSQAYINTIKMWLSYVGDYDRVMYGTDWPIVNIEKYIEFIKRIIPKEHYEKVFYENAKRIYNLKI